LAFSGTDISANSPGTNATRHNHLKDYPLASRGKEREVN
jgi:hypothetical protein